MNLSKSVIKQEETVTVSCKITNTGSYAGDEVVQLYIRDELASLARPVMELKGFERVHLGLGESAKVTFNITREHLMMYNINMQKKSRTRRFSDYDRCIIQRYQTERNLKGGIVS